MPAEHAGMGAVPYEGGVAFRVWAPHADAVWVMGTFNDWSREAHPLALEGDGYWSVDVPEAAAGDEYKFVLRNGEQELARVDPYARQVTNSVGNAVVYDGASFDWEGDDFPMPPANELVLYELHAGTFADENPDGPGTLRSAIRRLDHLRDLGINVVNLMPVAEFPGDYSWGYNPAHPFAVESVYGGPDALKAFVKAAHARGLAVILDVVYNHFGPSDLDLWRFDGWGEDGYGGIYFYNDHRADTPWGQTRPDYGRPEVRQYIRDNALMWLEAFRVDGLRWDGTVFIRDKSFHQGYALPDGWQLMQAINREMKERNPAALLIAEDLQGDPALTQPSDRGGAGFDAQWDAAFVHPLRQVLTESDDEHRDLEAVRAAIEHHYNDNAFERVIYTESHDEVANGRARLPEEMDPAGAESWVARKRSTLGAALVLTSPGLPMLFQGQELLEDEWFRDTDPLDWSRLERFGGIHALYRDLIALRRNQRGITGGLTGSHVNVYHLDHGSKLLAFHRWSKGGPGDDTVIVVNLANRSHAAYRLGVPREGPWRVRFNSDATVYSEDFGDHPAEDVDAGAPAEHGMPASAEVSIGPYTALLFSQDPDS